MQLTTLMSPFFKPVLGGYLIFLITVCSSYLNKFFEEENSHKLFENHDYELHICSRVFDLLGTAVTNFRTARVPGGGLVQLLIPARQRNCPLPAGITTSKKPVGVSSSHDTQRVYSGYPLGIMGFFFRLKNA